MEDTSTLQLKKNKYEIMKIIDEVYIKSPYTNKFIIESKFDDHCKKYKTMNNGNGNLKNTEYLLKQFIPENSHILLNYFLENPPTVLKSTSCNKCKTCEKSYATKIEHDKHQLRHSSMWREYNDEVKLLVSLCKEKKGQLQGVVSSIKKEFTNKGIEICIRNLRIFHFNINREMMYINGEI